MEISKGKAPLSVSHPEISSLANGWDPNTVSAGSSKKLEWKCLKGHTFVSTVGGLVFTFYKSDSKGCPVCANRIVLKGFNDLATTHPEIAREAYGWDPTTVTGGTKRKFNWICSEGHVFSQSLNYRTRIDKRVRKNDRDTDSNLGKEVKNCPICNGSTIISGINDLASQFPEIAKEAFGWDPSTVAKRSGLKFNWKCEEGHIYLAAVANRTVGGTGCPVCAGKTISVGFNDLSSTNPEVAQEAYGWDPRTVTAGTAQIKQWKCSSGHIFKASVKSRKNSWPSGCPVCANKVVLKNFNDLATTHPEIAREAHGWDPTTVTRGNTKKLEWMCSKGHIFVNNCNARTHLGRSCPVCASQEVLPGYNDLMTTHPDIALRAYGWDPSTVFAGTQKKFQWKCDQGHIWRADVNSQKRSGCPSCSISGFDPNKDGWLYFLSHPHWEMLQIGITNVPESRLGSHRKLGWEVLELRGPMDGHLTQQWEQRS